MLKSQEKREGIHEGNLHHRGRSGKEIVPTAWRGSGQDGPYPQEAVTTAIPTFHFGLEEMVTDRLRLLSAALKDLDIRDGQKTGLWADKRAENSHQPSRRGEWAIPADANTSEVRIRPTFSSLHFQHGLAPLMSSRFQADTRRRSCRLAWPSCSLTD
jgi:hypothetical protein